MQAVPSGYSVAHYTHGWTVEPRCKREWVCPHALDAIAAADDLATGLRIIEQSGLDVTDTTRDQLASYVASNPRGVDGRIVYDLRADFGLEPDELYERYAFYFDAFPQIRREVS